MRALLFFLLAGLSYGQTLPAHPRLLFNAEGIARLKARSVQPEWSAQWKAFQSRFDNALKTDFVLPPRGANWAHWYVCPTHGARLTTGKKIGDWQWEHICTVGHEILRGDPTRPDRDFDGCVLAGAHDRLAHEVQTGGILYQVTGDARYAARGRAILLAYADHYASYPLHTTKGEAKIGGGHIHPQTLDESVWLIPAAQGADLIWDTLSAQDRKTIAEKLFLPAARDTILAHKMGIHNIQNWKNSAVGVTGFLLGDAALIHAAIDDPDRGYRQQMAKGVQPDGVWWEGSWGYHAYTMSAVWGLTEAAHNCGIDLYGEPYKKMFEAPILFAMPNLMLPAFNDSAEGDVHNPLYELAYARYHDPIYLAALAGSNRHNDMAMWFGVDRLPDDSAPALKSRNATESGYAILQRGAGAQATWVCLKYGPHGGGHGHPDKNNFVLYSRGRVLFPDPGTRPYGSPLHFEWDRVTLAHNTLVVDQANQAEATGKSLAFGSDHGIDYAMTDAGAIYKSVRYVRTAVLLNENLVLFVDQVEADQPHTFDLATHVIGKWNGVPAGEKLALPGSGGYQHLQDVAATQSSASVSLPYDGEVGKGLLVLAGNAPTQVITATGVGKSTEDRIPAAIFRRTGKQTVYAWAASLDGAPVKVEVSAKGTGIAAVRVSGASGSWAVTVDRDKAAVGIEKNPQ